MKNSYILLVQIGWIIVIVLMIMWEEREMFLNPNELEKKKKNQLYYWLFST